MARPAARHSRLTAEQRAEVAEIKRVEEEFLGLVNHLVTHAPHRAREFALARTNIQQAAFWAEEAITG